MHRYWVEIRPKAADTDGVWGLILFHIGVIEIDGLTGFVYSDPSEFFLPEGPLVKNSATGSEPHKTVPPK